MGHPPSEILQAWGIHMALSAGVSLTLDEWDELPVMVRDDLLMIRTTPVESGGA